LVWVGLGWSGLLWVDLGAGFLRCLRACVELLIWGGHDHKWQGWHASYSLEVIFFLTHTSGLAAVPGDGKELCYRTITVFIAQLLL
jgi:hypothetical protein